jgi:hypothetical protein
MTKTLRLGIVGLDHRCAAPAIADELSRSDAYELVAIAHRHEQCGQPTAAKYDPELTAEYEVRADPAMSRALRRAAREGKVIEL